MGIYYPIFQALEAGLWMYYYWSDHIDALVVPRVRVEGGALHCSSGPALTLPQESLYYLHGVRVGKELVMTPAERLDPHILLTEWNAEVRREIVRKIGMERIIMILGAKSLDKQGDYELLELDLGDGRRRPYLKMRNPSIHTWHVEGVPPGTETVAEALAFRKPEAMSRVKTSENGAEWYQQGDVVVWPEGAKFLRPAPTILT